jgi:hypothetical protein
MSSLRQAPARGGFEVAPPHALVRLRTALGRQPDLLWTLRPDDRSRDMNRDEKVLTESH